MGKTCSCSPPPLPSSLLLFSLFLASLVCFSSAEDAAAANRVAEINLEFPTLQFIPSYHVGYSASHGSQEFVSCGRVLIVGISRYNISRYANSFHVVVKASGVPERHHSKVEVCFHRNASVGLCQCKRDEWRNLQKGQWDAVMSPYGDRFVDVKFDSRVSGSITISIEEEFQQWRLLCLAFGFALVLLAPIVSSWVPFYYSSSMALGVLLVILIIMFQGMKLIPTGRKSFLYLTIYGSILGAGSFLVHYFSMVVNSILVNFGLNEEMYNPVSVFLLAGITLAGAALGYWVVRKFVLSEDGTVDAGIAQFVKWAMRIFGLLFIFQSTLDTILALAMLVMFWSVCSVLTLFARQLRSPNRGNLRHENIWQLKTRQVAGNHRRAEFLSRSPNTGSRKPSLSNPNGPYAWSDSPTKGLVYSTPSKKRTRRTDYYSTFHKTPTQKFSKKEWDNFTSESTREALAELASMPDFSDWIAENGHRIHLTPKEGSDDSADSSSDSSEETVVESDNGLSFFGRFIPH